MTDDQDVRSLGVMPKVEAQLQGEGTTFDNFYATFPLCCPSRATFLTGQYAHNHGVLDNGGPEGGVRAFDPRNTLPVTLQRGGYRTGYIGKYLNGYKGTSIPPGWSDWHARTTGGMYDYEVNENGRLRRYGSRLRHYQTDVFAQKATRFIGQSTSGAQPFFLTLSIFAPHSEGMKPPRAARRHQGSFKNARLPEPPSFDERDVSDKPSFVRSLPRLNRASRRQLTDLYRGRLESLLAADDAVGDVIEKLRSTGELSNTLVIFTSDNGFLLGEHRLVRKTQLYEESARVPLVMRGPGVPAGVHRGQVSGNIDLAPTILDAANLQPDRVVDGISLLPLALDGQVGPDRDILLENQVSSALRAPSFMYAEHPGGERELYDMRADPLQLTSRHSDPAFSGAQTSLQQRLRQLQSCAGASCR